MLCLNDTLRKSILQKLNSKWTHLFSNKLPKNRNEILFCSDLDRNALFLPKPFTENNYNLNNNNGTAMALLNDISKTFKEINNNEL